MQRFGLKDSLERWEVNDQHLSHQRGTNSVQEHAVCEETYLKDGFHL